MTVKQHVSERQRRRQKIGRRGEEAACEFLLGQGMKIVDRNWKCGYGEADIIALDDKTLVFCEVRTRTTAVQGDPAQSITAKKRERYYKLIQVFRSRTAIRHNAVRFDFIGIHVDQISRRVQLHYVRNVSGAD
ncbi:MAG: YraN family protein [Coriobacteriia bacterium]|nr:YraN family protein [Coriobacteriia bacterium]